jgi:hypothetical protein
MQTLQGGCQCYRAIVTEFRETEETTALRNTITMRLRKIVLMFTMHRKATLSTIFLSLIVIVFLRAVVSSVSLNSVTIAR